MSLQYDIVIGEDGGLVLFIFKQDGVPDNPTVHYNQHSKTVTFRRHPDQDVHNIELVADKAIKAFQDNDQIGIIEVGQDDPEETISYTLKIGRS